MAWETIITVGVLIVSVISAPFIYIWKSVIQRIDIIERKLADTQTEQDVRNLLNDKLEPVKSDLTEIKMTLNKLLDRLIDKSL